MADNYESIDEALDIESGIVEVEKTSQLKPVEKTKNDIEKDYEYTRANLYSDRKSTRLNSSHVRTSRMPSSA